MTLLRKALPPVVAAATVAVAVGVWLGRTLEKIDRAVRLG